MLRPTLRVHASTYTVLTAGFRMNYAACTKANLHFLIVEDTGVDKGAQGAQAPQWPGKKELTLCLHLKDDISVTDILKISKIT